MSEFTLTRYDRMREAIVVAHSIDEVKEIVDKAEALKHYAKQVDESLDNQNKLAEIKLRAERRGGELSGKLPKKPGKRTDVTSAQAGQRLKSEVLKDAGVSHATAQRWESIFALPESVFETHIAETTAEKKELTEAGMLELAKGHKRDTDRAKKQEDRKESTVTVNDAIWHGDMRELGNRIASDSVDLILTDPPYPEEFLPLFSELSVLAARVLKPGGLCLVYSGQIFLPEVMGRLSVALDYAWTFAIRHSGGNQRIFKMNVNTGWKPVLAFYKPPLTIWWDSFIDVVSGGREKDLHEWQQAESEAAYFIEHLTLPGQVVVDPFCGSGTVLKAAKDLNRQYQGIELDPEYVARASRRLTS